MNRFDALVVKYSAAKSALDELRSVLQEVEDGLENDTYVFRSLVVQEMDESHLMLASEHLMEVCGRMFNKESSTNEAGKDEQCTSGS